MASTFAVTRNHLIFGLCLPLAVLLGYLLAEPMDSSSVAVVVMVICVLVVPLMISSHHIALIITWNATINPYFLPGRPMLWMVMAFISLLMAVISRSLTQEKRFIYVPSVTKTLLAFFLVVCGTAVVTGGVGLKMMGSDTYGGKGYFYIAAAVVGYFALSSTRIPLARAHLYAALFFLPGLTSLVSNLVYLVPSLWFLYDLFPPSFASDQARADYAVGPHIMRIAGVIPASQAIHAYMLGRYGLRGIFDFGRPWRMFVFLSVLILSLFGGYRSSLVGFGFIFLAMFFVEGLWRTRFAAMLAAVAVLAGIALAGFSDRMPFAVQRTVSFIPFLNLDPIVKGSSESSSEWRVNMWRVVLPEVPHYLLKGKGYAMSGRELEMIQDPAFMTKAAEGAIFAGDYHNGPLSVIIPFGIWGVIAFLWFAGAGIRLLSRNFNYGHPSLSKLNATLLALFIAKLLFFISVFGALSTDLCYFTGILGFSVALNHGEAQPSNEWEEEVLELQRA